MFLLNAVKLISVRARRFPGPPDAPDRPWRERRGCSELETTGAGGVPPHSPLPSGSPESLVDPAPFSVFSLVLFSQSCEELFVEVRFAHCEARGGGGGARTVLSKRLSRFQTFPSPPKVPSSPSLPLWTRPVHILRFNRLSVADEAGVSSAPSPHFCHDSSF